ncbi:MAG: GumC family protein [Candidatus Polarisedimenticolia bacterium]
MNDQAAPQQDVNFIQKLQERTLRDLAVVLFRHKKTIVSVFLLILGAVALGTFTSPRVYRSDAKLLLKLGRENLVMDPTMGRDGQSISITQSRESQINSEIEILKSREVVSLVIDHIGLPVLLGRPLTQPPEGTAGERHEAMRRFNEALTLEVLRESNIITLAFRASSPELAQQVLDTLIEVYKTHHIRAHSRQEARDFFVDQTRQLEKDLAGTEGELRDLKNSASIGSLPEQRTILLDRIGRLEQDIQQADASVTVSEIKIQTMTALLKDIPEEVVSERTAQSPGDAMRTRLYDLQMREQDLLSKYKEESEPIREIRRQIAEAKTLLQSDQPTLTQVTTQINQQSSRVKQDLIVERTALAAGHARSTVLRQDLEKARMDLRTLNVNEVRLAQLERQLGQQRASYEKYASSMQEAQIGEALERERISSISIVQPPTFDGSPVSPRTRLNMMLGLMLGAFGGIGLAFVKEFMDGTIKTRRDIEERLRVSHLVSIPKMDAPSIGSDLRALPPASHGEDDEADEEDGNGATADEPRGVTALARRSSPTDHAADAFVDYTEDILEQLAGTANGSFKTPCTIAVTSCHGGEGVSTVAASIAATLRVEGAEHVRLVNAKAIRRSGQGVILPAEAISEIGVPPRAGERPRSLEARSSAELLTQLRRDGSCVVLDMPPVMEKASSVRLASLADGVVLVVKAEATRWQVAAEARERLMRANANLLGVVLNQRLYHVPNWIHRRL